MNSIHPNPPPLFREIQRFNQVWLWLVILLPGLFFLVLFLQKALYGSASIPVERVPLWILILNLGLIPALFASIKLVTEIRPDGVYVRFFPFHFSLQRFAFEDLKQCEVRTYSPLKEYGGWGLRWSLSGKGKAYNIRGDQGLQLETRQGKKLLIGTQQPDQLKRVLEQLKKR